MPSVRRESETKSLKASITLMPERRTDVIRMLRRQGWTRAMNGVDLSILCKVMVHQILVYMVCARTGDSICAKLYCTSIASHYDFI